ncbi:hypothetical protein A2Z67_02720 [Candidatus Woesebacteria bacterium RBG_13_36_22]|uniref:Uncharacterized protein n=1 Tax=Candidatus Woesebacteria bacterium RBG_13_36_22 TaxID=1802478 RepID=A0A1F7X6G8_9BACT|nr:MAG: hypothetical protein A2Z67_02720 [Candidatus Woesebacteria bacterium RBG_13_36_22]
MLSILFLNNGKGDAVTGHYFWKVMINDTTIAKGELKNHRRALGWQGLLRKFVKSLEKERQK